MPKKITSNRGQVSNVKMFHADGSPEIRLTVLANKKRLDVHLFDVDNPTVGNLTLVRLLTFAASGQVKDGHKIEIGPGNLSDLNLDGTAPATASSRTPAAPATAGSGTPATPATFISGPVTPAGSGTERWGQSRPDVENGQNGDEENAAQV